MTIEWREQKVLLKDLQPYERNPRRITKTQFERLKAAISKVGFHTPLLATIDYKILAGHQRLRALRELGVTEVVVRIPSRVLTEDEFKQILVQSNLQMGEFDMDVLANDFMPRDLIEWGFPDFKTDLASVAPAEPAEREEQQNVKNQSHTCPSCGLVF